MKNALMTFIVIIFCSGYSYSQANGLRVYGGLTTMKNQDPIANPVDQIHSGYHIGVDGRMLSGGMSFMVGARFTSISRTAVDNIKLYGHDSQLTIMNGRGGLDFALYSIGDFFRVRSKVLFSFDISLTASGEPTPPADYKLNDSWLGAVTGLGFDIGPATLDVEYEHGFINAYNQKKSSKFNSWTVSAGFFF